jgi:hypothetical protein
MLHFSAWIGWVGDWAQAGSAGRARTGLAPLGGKRMKKFLVAVMLGLFFTTTLPLRADDGAAAAPAAAPAKPAKHHKAKAHKKSHKKSKKSAAPADGAAK